MVDAQPNTAAGRPANKGPGPARAPVVLQVLPALVTGGVERGTVDIAAAVAAAGWTSLVASAGGPMVTELERAGAEHFRLPLDTKNALRIYRNTGDLSHLIESRGVDLVHARSRAPAWSALNATRRMGCHFVTTYHGTYNAQNLFKRWYNSVMARGEKVIAISDFIAGHVAERYHRLPRHQHRHIRSRTHLGRTHNPACQGLAAAGRDAGDHAARAAHALEGPDGADRCARRA